MRPLMFALLFSLSTLSFAKENPMSASPTKVKLTTSLGAITIQLNPEKAPISSANFLTYVKEGFYNGTIFHRVIPDFMAQGGGFDTSFTQKAVHAPIKNEANNGLANKRGTLAMARTMVVDSATCQFFINLEDRNTFLNFRNKTPQEWGYCVFGKVIEGMDIVDKIAKVPTGFAGPHQNVPTEPVVILSIRRKDAAQ